MTETQKFPNRLPAWAAWLLCGLCLLPPLVLAVLLRQNAVNVPYWDEWDDDLAGFFLKWKTGGLGFGDFWAQHNESRLVLPRMVFLALGSGSHWNLCWQMAATFLLAGGAAVMVFWLGRKTFAERPLTAWLATVIASLLIFSPAQYQAWLWGLEMILYLPLVFILASLLVLQRNFTWRTKLFFCAALATLSTYSFSNGLLAWPVLFPVLFLAGGGRGLRNNRRAALLWLFAFLANVALYFQDYRFPDRPGLWPMLWTEPWSVLKYFCAFLGGPLADQNSIHELPLAVAIGGGQFLVFAAVGLAIFRRWNYGGLTDRAWPWLTLGGYGILSALLATAGRVAFGPEQALAPRYGIFGVCLTVALVYLVPLLAFHPSSPDAPPRTKVRVTVALLGAVVVGLHALTLSPATVNLTVFSSDLRLAKCSLEFLDVLPPQPATTAFLCFDDQRVKRMADALNRTGVRADALHQSRRLADFPQNPPPAASPGTIEICQVAGTNLFLAGWALAPARHEPADGVVFTCEADGVAPEIFALIDLRLVRTDLVKKNHDPVFLLAGWQKTCPLADLPKGKLLVKAWSYDLATGRLTPLANEVHLLNR